MFLKKWKWPNAKLITQIEEYIEFFTLILFKRRIKMDKIVEMKKRRKWAHDQLTLKKFKVYEVVQKMEETTFANGELSGKYKELIAVGISVTLNCESCMQWHVEKAYYNGATEQEILEAIEVGIEMGGGPAATYARFALEVLDRIVNR